MRIAMTGATGLIGQALVTHWQSQGHEVRSLRRGVDWDPDAGTVRDDVLHDVQAVVHLAGENVAARRWTDEQKRKIVDSRARGTTTIARAVAARPGNPPTLVCASATGYYGDRGDEVLTESSAAGQGFLAENCVEWERSADAARAAGARVVHLRLGIVLALEGGALDKMLPPFRAGVGGRLGDGRQWMSWIALEDVVRAFDHAVTQDHVAGPFNLVAPTPVRNADFTRTLAHVLHRPAFLPVPAFALRMLLGEMADALLLSSARVLPQRLLATHFAFVQPALEPALRSLLR